MNHQPRKRLVILASGSGSNAQAFIDACRSGSLDAEIVALICNRPGAFAFERAKQAGIPGLLLDHTAFSSRESFDGALADLIEQQQPDLVILAGFMRILTPEFVSQFKGRLMNIHPSLLPKYPGLRTHQRAIDAGDSEHGATVHFVTEELDGGPGILQARVPILPGDDANSLAQRVLAQEHRIYPVAAQWFISGRLRLQDGVSLLDGKPVNLSPAPR